ncbi:hypothetical protein DM02DRAFT_539082 [Periconia macrospinosa]|uniref:Rhodopsin domain-containing protein n=1 Tax=Periconia macrospinosa TaxID=97972 RepID=A0A2V1D917_9PLEO|nr:hypothetical protein DM02DRAFT_539082 [Periconia macrospinosa]
MDDLISTVICINVIAMILTILATCSRVGRRVFIVHAFSWHDAFITIAAINALVTSLLQMYGTGYGLGQHMKNIEPKAMPKLLKIIFSSTFPYYICNWAVKHALLLFYAEISFARSHRILMYIMHFVAFGFGLSSILVTVFQCTPVRKAWQLELDGHCINFIIFSYINASIMVITDLVLYIMPVVFTRNLQLRRAQRIGLNCMFGMGILVLSASVMRLHTVHMLAQDADFSYRFANAMIWAVIENHLAIIVACAPSIKSIVMLVFPHIASSFRRTMSRLTTSSKDVSSVSVREIINVDIEMGDKSKTEEIGLVSQR